MLSSPPPPARIATQSVRHALREAGDAKLRRVTAMLDEVADTAGKQAILDPLRDRLGSLKPVRPLRFARLLFIPLDPLIVEASAWRAGDASVPRSVLGPLSAVVAAGLGDEVARIERMTGGHKTDAIHTIAAAGDILWSRAAGILAASAVPAGWEDTGLRPALYRPLAGAVAAVLHRANWLLQLRRDEDLGVREASRTVVEAIVRDIGGEPAEGATMIAGLVLLQSPHAAPMLWDCLSSVRNTAGEAVLQRAMAGGMEWVLTRMEGQSGIMDDLNRAPLAMVGEQVRRLAAFLRHLDDDTAVAANRPRVRAIRDRVDAACRSRFADGIAEGIAAPLTTAPGALDGAGQTGLETRARELRTLECSARTIGGARDYDALLSRASDTVRAAGEAGVLSLVRQCRLIEILSGPDSAVAAYRAVR